MAASTYVGTGLMTKIYLGVNEIAKIYLGVNLVYSSVVAPTQPQKIYTDFDLVLKPVTKITNVYTDFGVDLQEYKN
jgi:hypothetical protein